jgi:hypothetical protein
MLCFWAGCVIICSDPDPVPSIKKQKSKKNLDLCYIVTSFLSLKNDVNVP